MKRILAIPGDGIGPEVMELGIQFLEVISKRYDVPVDVKQVDWGAERWLREGVGIPKGELENIPDNYDAILFGALGDPRIPDMAHGREILLGLRTGLDLYINLRPSKILHPSLGALKDNPGIDFVIFRENTQDCYQAIGGRLGGNTLNEVAIDESIHTYEGVRRIIAAAFDYAQHHGRKKVTLVDKSNAIKHGGSLWTRVFKEQAQKNSHLKADHLFVDVAAMYMVQDPARFDVIVTTNLFGDILSDLGAGLTGGLGLAASANIHPNKIALFEPVHGSAPDIAGKGIANPFAMFLSVGMMFEYFGLMEPKRVLEALITDALTNKRTTPDLSGDLKSKEAARYIIDRIR